MASMLDLDEGTSVSYEVLGAGIPILGMPGGPGIPAQYVRRYADGLTDRLAWYLIDPPGTGESTPPPEPSGYSIEAHGAFYRSVAGALGLDRYLLFGHSYSAILALTMAAGDDRVLGCILTGAPAVGVEPDAAEGAPIRTEMNALLARHEKATWYADATAAWEEQPSSREEAVAMMRRIAQLDFSDPDRPGVREALDEMISSLVPDMTAMGWFYEHEWPSLDLRPRLGEIRAPVLVVVGEHDWEAPPIQARVIVDGVPDGRMVVVPAAGHFVPLEAPEAFRDAVVSWLGTRFGA